MATVLFFIRRVLPINLAAFLIIVFIGAVIYITVMFFLIGPSIIVDIKKGISNIFKK